MALSSMVEDIQLEGGSPAQVQADGQRSGKETRRYGGHPEIVTLEHYGSHSNELSSLRQGSVL